MRGNDLAQFEFGQCYEFGYGVEQDVSLAIEWYQLAKMKHNIQAQTRLNQDVRFLVFCVCFFRCLFSKMNNCLFFQGETPGGIELLE